MNEAPATEEVGVRTGRRPAHGVRRRLRRHSGTITGAAVLSLIALAVLFGSAVHDVGMSLEHPLGTDNLGRDTLARMLAGGRISLAVGTAAMVLSLLLVSIMLFRDPLQSALGLEVGIFILIVVVIGITSWMQTAR